MYFIAVCTLLLCWSDGKKILESVGEVVDKYQGSRNRSLRARLGSHPSGHLYPRYDNAFKTRTKDYRNPQVHDWGFPAIGPLIPRRDYLAEWTDEDLGKLDGLLNRNDAAERINKEFIDAVQQAGDDLSFAETVINDVWGVALDELTSITQNRCYGSDQSKGATSYPSKMSRGRVDGPPSGFRSHLVYPAGNGDSLPGWGESERQQSRPIRSAAANSPSQAAIRFATSRAGSNGGNRAGPQGPADRTVART